MTRVPSLIPPLVLLRQVCEERLQFSLSENVKTNVLWGSTIKDTVTLRPWGEQIKENSTEAVTEDEEYQEERYGKADRDVELTASAVPFSESELLLKSVLVVVICLGVSVATWSRNAVPARSPNPMKRLNRSL